MSSYGKRNLPMVSEYEVGKKRDFRSQVSKHRVLVVVFFLFSNVHSYAYKVHVVCLTHVYT